jgi:predicted adenine nucleotide alpha hydrolase (AANH) superfamily ATPase
VGKIIENMKIYRPKCCGCMWLLEGGGKWTLRRERHRERKKERKSETVSVLRLSEGA